jgi:hypothetical protein
MFVAARAGCPRLWPHRVAATKRRPGVSLLTDTVIVIAEEQWLSTLRPSRVRMVQAGAPAWAEAELIDVDSGQASLGSALEAFGLRVRRTAVGQARHLVAALSEPPAADFVVLQCHGDEGAIVLPGLAEEVERYQPFHGRISAADLRGFARCGAFTGSGTPATARSGISRT